MQQSAVLPLQGAAAALLILGGAWLLGVPQALGMGRIVMIPVAMLFGLAAGRWLIRPMVATALLLLLLIGIGVATPIATTLGSPFVRNDSLDLRAVDAVFVFSGGVNSRGLITGESLDRLLFGIAERARRPELPLVLSIVRHNERPDGASSQADQRKLTALAPAEGGVEWIDSVASTRDEAVRLSRLAFQHRWKRVVAITSPMHTRRACATLESLGLAVTCVAAPWRQAAWPPKNTGDRLLVIQRVVYETLAWTQYRLTGWARWSR
jgi:uncharacterized SAM-binding protein YcdF (DUF218 family)